MARSNGLKVKVQTLCPDSGRLQREFAAANGSLAIAERCIKMSTNCKDKQPNFCERHLRTHAAQPLDTGAGLNPRGPCLCSIIKDRVRGIYLRGKDIGLVNKETAVAV